jgi:hypothetical protein
MSQRIVRSLIYSFWCHVIDCSVRPYSPPQNLQNSLFHYIYANYLNTVRFIWWWSSIQQPSACVWVEVRIRAPSESIKVHINYPPQLGIVLKSCSITDSTHIKNIRRKWCHAMWQGVLSYLAGGNTQHHALCRYVTRGFVCVHWFAAVKFDFVLRKTFRHLEYV